MRRGDREITDPAIIRQTLDECKVCRLGLWDGAEPYVVPMNFGYVWDSEGLVLYFHCATEGRRMDILRQRPQVGFEMDCGCEVYGQGDRACTYSCRFTSIIGGGTAEALEEPAEKLAGLRCIMRCQTGRDFPFTEEMTNGVAVLRLRAEDFCCKRHE